MSGPAPKTKHRDIMIWNHALLATLPNVKFGRDWGVPAEIKRLSNTCWGCGIDTEGKATRCHVIARRNGGPDHPSNFFLLCNICHDAQPDGLDREGPQVEWLMQVPPWIERCREMAVRLTTRLLDSAPGVTWDDLNRWMDARREEFGRLIETSYLEGRTFEGRGA